MVKEVQVSNRSGLSSPSTILYAGVKFPSDSLPLNVDEYYGSLFAMQSSEALVRTLAACEALQQASEFSDGCS